MIGNKPAPTEPAWKNHPLPETHFNEWTPADEHNEEWLGPNTLGIEVTRDAFAKRCGLGNIDPQHSDGPTDYSRQDSSAIEAALTWELPPDGAKLVTLRYDKDAIGAMAVLMLRADGRSDAIDRWLVQWIGILDCMPYRAARAQYPKLAALFDVKTTDAMNFIVHNGD